MDQGVEPTTQPPPQRPEAITPITLDAPPSEQKVEQKEAVTDKDWNEIIALRQKSLAELDNDPTSAARLEELTGKAKRVLGDGFKQELTARQQQEQEKQRQKTAEENQRKANLLLELEKTRAEALNEMKNIMGDLDAKTTQRSRETDEKMATLHQEIEKQEAKTPEQTLQEALNDPKMVSVKAELSWLDLMAGKPVEGVDPELKRRIDELRKNAMQKIMADPKGYEKELQALKDEFYQSRGINLQNQPKANAI